MCCNEPVIEAGLSPCFLLNAAVFESSAVSSLGPSPFPKKLSRDAWYFSYSFWPVLAGGLTKTVTETRAQCGEEAWTEW